MSSAPSTAAQTVSPMRPAAPATATRITVRPPARRAGRAPRRRRAPERHDRGVEDPLVGADAGDRQALGREQLAGELAQIGSSETASIRSITSSTERIGMPCRIEAPRWLMRAAVDSSDEHDPSLEVLARAGQLLLVGRVLDAALQLGRDHGERLRRGCPGACRRTARPRRCARTGWRRRRPSRPARAARAPPGTGARRTCRRARLRARAARSAARRRARCLRRRGTRGTARCLSPGSARGGANSGRPGGVAWPSPEAPPPSAAAIGSAAPARRARRARSSRRPRSRSRAAGSARRGRRRAARA